MATEEKTKTKSGKLTETQTKKNEELKILAEARKSEELKDLTPLAVLNRGKERKKKAKAKFKKRIVEDCKKHLSDADAIPVLILIQMREDNCVPATPEAILNILKKEFHSIPWEISISAAHETINRDGSTTVRFDYRRNTDTK